MTMDEGELKWVRNEDIEHIGIPDTDRNSLAPSQSPLAGWLLRGAHRMAATRWCRRCTNHILPRDSTGWPLGSPARPTLPHGLWCRLRRSPARWVRCWTGERAPNHPPSRPNSVEVVDLTIGKRRADGRQHFGNGRATTNRRQVALSLTMASAEGRPPMQTTVGLFPPTNQEPWPFR